MVSGGNGRRARRIETQAAASAASNAPLNRDSPTTRATDSEKLNGKPTNIRPTFASRFRRYLVGCPTAWTNATC